MRKKISIVLLMFFVLNISTIFAVNYSYDIQYTADSYYISPGDIINIKLKLNNATAGVTAYDASIYDLQAQTTNNGTAIVAGTEAFENFSVVGSSLRPPCDWDYSNLTGSKYPYKLSFAGDGSTLGTYVSGEDMSTLTFKLKEDYKGSKASIKIVLNELIMPGSFENYPNLGEKIITFNVQQDSQTMNTTVRYDISPSYMVTIPENVEASDLEDVIVGPITGDVNLEDGKQVKISVNSGTIVLERYKLNGIDKVTGEGAQTINALLRLGTNEDIDSTTAIALFEYGTTNLINDNLYIKKIDATNKRAGVYLGNITFNLSMIDKQ